MSALDWDAIGREAIGHLKDLLRIDTTNPPGNERPAAEYLAAVLAREGIEATIVESAPGRASLVARLTGSGARPPLMLAGHLDVVPADAERWRHPPFAAVEDEGCIWGRGAIDMKNMVAMSLVTLLLAKRQGLALERDLVLAAVADEEAGCEQGSLWLVEHHPELVRAEYVLGEVGGHSLYLGDTTLFPIQVSEKGICWLELVARGEPGHGSMPRPDNAVVRVARAVAHLAGARLGARTTPVVAGFLDALARAAPLSQRAALVLLKRPALAPALLGLIARRDPDQALGLAAMLANTVSPTGLAAGVKINVIPGEARALIDGRVLPGASCEAFLDDVRAIVGDDVDVRVRTRHDGATFDSRTPLFEALARVLTSALKGSVPVPYMIPGFTDACAWRKLGATCYGFSPVLLPRGMSFQRMYHGHDERIPVDGFVWGVRRLYEVVASFCAGA